MTIIAWSLVALWGLVLLTTARPTLRGLPPPSDAVPPYAVWLPAGGEAPPLEPAPARVFGGALPEEGPDRLLVLGAGVEVDPSLPGRLAACGPFVSVLPRPTGGPVGQQVERMVRDFANLAAVTELTQAAGYADARCAWLRRSDLRLPGAGREPILRAARGRKAHGLPVDLRDGYAGDEPRGPQLVRAPGRSLAALRAAVPELTLPDPVARSIWVGFSLTLSVGPWPLLAVPECRPAALLAIGLGATARLMTALREGFGFLNTVTGWLIEPLAAIQIIRAAPTPIETAMPAVQGPPPSLTQARPVETGGWLDQAAVPYLARRLGGSAPVMEQLYGNRPAGARAIGRIIDRWVHASPAARAVRHRWVVVGELGRRLAPERVLSVPSGSGRDVAAIAPPSAVLVDPDPAARALAARLCPTAERVDGTVANAPVGPFDLAIYVGLAEYLDDSEVVRHLTELRARLVEGGALITSTTAANAAQARMSGWLGWETRGRSPEAMVELLDAAGFTVARRRVDPQGIQWVFLALPRVG